MGKLLINIENNICYTSTATSRSSMFLIFVCWRRPRFCSFGFDLDKLEVKKWGWPAESLFRGSNLALQASTIGTNDMPLSHQGWHQVCSSQSWSFCHLKKSYFLHKWIRYFVMILSVSFSKDSSYMCLKFIDCSNFFRRFSDYVFWFLKNNQSFCFHICILCIRNTNISDFYNFCFFGDRDFVGNKRTFIEFYNLI